MQIRIALVIGQLSLGGSEKQLYLLAKGLQKTDRYNVSVIVLSDITEPYKTLLNHVNIHVFSLKQYLHYFDIFRILQLRKIIKKNSINIMCSFSLTANFYSFFAIIFLNRCIFISGSRNVESDRSRLLQKVDDFIIRHSNILITNSQENFDHLKKLSKHSDDINGVVIRNGIEIPFDNSINEKPEDSRVTIGTVALFKEQKNYPLFIDLCKSITNEYSNVNFIAIGTGPEFDTMTGYAISKNIDSKISFMGNRIDATEIISKEFDIFVLTSKREGLPNAIMEAMSLGIPVVATDVGGVSELVQHGETGFLLPSGDLEGLKKYCKMLINDPDLRAKMGQKGQDFIQNNFSDRKMVKEFEKIFNRLLNN